MTFVKGQNSSFLGRFHSPETRKKMSDTHKAHPHAHWTGITPELHPKWKGGLNRLPVCNCGKRLSTMKGKYCQPCFHKFFQGSNHASWKGGITPDNFRIRNSSSMKEWRRHVFQRDDYTCQTCAKRGVLLGRTLCVPCHRKTPTFAARTFKMTY